MSLNFILNERGINDKDINSNARGRLMPIARGSNKGMLAERSQHEAEQIQGFVKRAGLDHAETPRAAATAADQSITLSLGLGSQGPLRSKYTCGPIKTGSC